MRVNIDFIAFPGLVVIAVDVRNDLIMCLLIDVDI